MSLTNEQIGVDRRSFLRSTAGLIFTPAAMRSPIIAGASRPPQNLLRCRSHYSFGESTASIDSLIDRAVELNLPALALVDREHLIGAAEFCRKARLAGIKPIVGLEIDVEFDESVRISDRSLTTIPNASRDYNYVSEGRPLILLAHNNAGFRNLIRLSAKSGSPCGPWFRRPTICERELCSASDGLICLSGGDEGMLATAMGKGHYDIAKAVVSCCRAIFGEQYFVEFPAEYYASGPASTQLADFVHQLRVRSVVTAEINCVTAEEVALLGPATDLSWIWVGPPHRPKPVPSGMCVGNHESRCRQLAVSDGTYQDTAQLIELVQFDFDALQRHAIERKIGIEWTAEAAVAKSCIDGLKHRFGVGLERLPAGWSRDTMDRRLVVEFDTLRRCGMFRSIVVLLDVLGWANGRGIELAVPAPFSGCLVTYLLGLCPDCPPAGGEAFALDAIGPRSIFTLEVNGDDHPKVFEYLESRYGVQKVAHLGTIDGWGIGYAAGELAKLEGMSREQIQAIRRLARYQEFLPQVPVPPPVPPDTEIIRQILATAKLLMPLPSDIRTQRDSIVIGDSPLAELIPLLRTNRSERLFQNLAPELTPCLDAVTQWGVGELRQLGLTVLELRGRISINFKDQPGNASVCNWQPSWITDR